MESFSYRTPTTEHVQGVCVCVFHVSVEKTQTPFFCRAPTFPHYLLCLVALPNRSICENRSPISQGLGVGEHFISPLKFCCLGLMTKGYFFIQAVCFIFPPRKKFCLRMHVSLRKIESTSGHSKEGFQHWEELLTRVLGELKRQMATQTSAMQEATTIPVLRVCWDHGNAATAREQPKVQRGEKYLGSATASHWLTLVRSPTAKESGNCSSWG